VTLTWLPGVILLTLKHVRHWELVDSNSVYQTCNTRQWQRHSSQLREECQWVQFVDVKWLKYKHNVTQRTAELVLWRRVIGYTGSHVGWAVSGHVTHRTCWRAPRVANKHATTRSATFSFRFRFTALTSRYTTHTHTHTRAYLGAKHKLRRRTLT